MDECERLFAFLCIKLEEAPRSRVLQAPSPAGCAGGAFALGSDAPCIPTVLRLTLYMQKDSNHIKSLSRV